MDIKYLKNAISYLRRFKGFFIYGAYHIHWFFKFTQKRNLEYKNECYSIGITTFLDRYRVLLKPLVKRIVYCYPLTEIIIVANGYYDTQKQMKYLSKIEKFCSKYENVRLITFVNPQSLSKLWNIIINKSKSENVFILNDDIMFLSSFRRMIDNINLTHNSLVLINNSFSHFIISKLLVKKIGYFDERLKELGGEDYDYLVRVTIQRIDIKTILVEGLASYKPKLRMNSFGQLTRKQAGGYSNYNTDFLHKKWEITSKSLPGFTFVETGMGCFWKLKKGMDTPSFYEESNG